jgi:DNA polymerase-3 subunit gamma/tau
MMKKPEESKAAPEVNPNEQLRNAFSIDQLTLAWRVFSQKIKDDGRLSLFATLSKHEPTLSGEQVSFAIENAVQNQEMQEVRTELLDFLRERLGNYGIQLHIALTEHTEEQRSYSPMDQFKRMAEKNPDLLELKKRLDLDIDF